MNKLLELAAAFYGILIPRRYIKEFCRLVIEYLDEKYSIETAIGLALRKLKLN
ncbi:MAG: hypothetical protein QHH13_06525 [Melioribacter sp.]|uniref:hypothetical protein n=1 Tax=Rosettibacter primus TaxID=3111523 RepID=UPI00247E5688|nr:hypothetical protein [Melioribacter sp.]